MYPGVVSSFDTGAWAFVAHLSYINKDDHFTIAEMISMSRSAACLVARLGGFCVFFWEFFAGRWLDLAEFVVWRGAVVTDFMVGGVADTPAAFADSCGAGVMDGVASASLRISAAVVAGLDSSGSTDLITAAPMAEDAVAASSDPPSAMLVSLLALVAGTASARAAGASAGWGRKVFAR